MTDDAQSTPMAKSAPDGRDHPVSPADSIYAGMAARGVSAAGLHAAAMREVRQLIAQTRGNAAEIIRLGLARMESIGLISGHEMRGLQRVALFLLAGDHGDRDLREVCIAARDYHSTLVLDRTASPAAVTLAAIAAESVTESMLAAPVSPPGTLAAAAASGGGGGGSTSSADFGGAIGGMLAGAVLGGTFGPPIGGLFGGIGASIGHAVDKAKDKTQT